ncbi:MAG: orotate phosphoribosyltransferase [Verrucomicrobia bacterium]|nr:orotate phosphoribosyltransferase [Verrucomicrobiota bacterium]
MKPSSHQGRRHGTAQASEPNPSEVLDAFRKCGALLEGHFVLRSGLHSRQFFQCALVLQHAALAADLCAALARRVNAAEVDTVISPALGGIIVGQEVARSLGKRHIFAEKEEGKLVLRRGFAIQSGERFLVAEDVVTQGGRVKETMDIVRSHGGVVAAVAVLVDRSTTAVDFGVPFHSLARMQVETFPADRLPPDLAAVPAVKPGSR